MTRWFARPCQLLLLCGLFVAQSANAITLNVRNTEIAEVVEMISKQQRVNVLLSGEVSGEVSLNLYDTSVDKALRAVANAAGYALEKRGATYFILPHEEVGRYASGNVTQLRWYDLNYAEGADVEDVVREYLSNYGKVNFIEKRNLLVVEDRPEFLWRIDKLLKAIDRKPRQVMIEARILEVTLNDDENFGIDWADLFRTNGGGGSYGTQGFTAGPSAPGFFFDLVTPDVQVGLNALTDEGRLRTLSTPKLVALENQEASVVIGDRRGYQVTTTINQVTTESIEFLESGVILRVEVSIDDEGRILMSVHPEVSTGNVDVNGIPSQTTTEVTTNLLVPSGETVFIGGLIKKTDSVRRQSVPGINRIPVVRRLFSGQERNELVTETVVLITPTLAGDAAGWSEEYAQKVQNEEDTFPEPHLEPWYVPPFLSDDEPDSGASSSGADEASVPVGAGEGHPVSDAAQQRPANPPPANSTVADDAEPVSVQWLVASRDEKD